MSEWLSAALALLAIVLPLLLGWLLVTRADAGSRRTRKRRD